MKIKDIEYYFDKNDNLRYFLIDRELEIKESNILLDKDSNKLYRKFYEIYKRDFDPYKDNKSLILNLKKLI